MKLFITGPYTDREPEYRQLEDSGLTVVRGRSYDRFRDMAYAEDELIELCEDADMVLGSNRDTLSRRVLESATRLRLVVFPFIGVERVDVEAATELGVLVCNSPSPENVSSMAEATVALMLAEVKRLKHKESVLRQGRWGRPQDRGGVLFGKTVGLVGLGRIGRAVAQRLGPWQVRLLAYDPYVEGGDAQAVGVVPVDLDTLLEESDLVTVHMVVTRETRGMLGERELRKMKRTAHLVNTSRGETIQETALARALSEGWIAGAALDVFEQEPLPLESPLRELDPETVILTPHDIGHADAVTDGNFRLAIDSLLKGSRGEVPEYVVNKNAVSRWQGRWQR